jgi:thiamine biosynthesis lipoprotein
MLAPSPEAARPDTAELCMRAMGTDVHLIVVGGATGLLPLAAAMIDELEGKWSRFLPDSEVSRMNAAAGQPVAVSDETLELVARAIAGWHDTGGRFDPTLLAAVVAAGYDRSFEQLAPISPKLDNRGGHRGLRPPIEPPSRCGEIVVDRSASTVTIPVDAGFDPGGIGKGFAADLVATDVMAAGADGVCVNIGGDLRVVGAAPDGGVWTIEVEDPFGGASLGVIRMHDGGIATSSRMRRRWTHEDQPQHHLIDALTGRPATTGLAAATVWSGDATSAEILAKAAFLAGLDGAAQVLAGRSVSALLIDDSGAVHEVTPAAAHHKHR